MFYHFFDVYPFCSDRVRTPDFLTAWILIFQPCLHAVMQMRFPGWTPCWETHWIWAGFAQLPLPSASETLLMVNPILCTKDATFNWLVEDNEQVQVNNSLIYVQSCTLFFTVFSAFYVHVYLLHCCLPLKLWPCTWASCAQGIITALVMQCHAGETEDAESGLEQAVGCRPALHEQPRLLFLQLLSQ